MPGRRGSCADPGCATTEVRGPEPLGAERTVPLIGPKGFRPPDRHSPWPSLPPSVAQLPNSRNPLAKYQIPIEPDSSPSNQSGFFLSSAATDESRIATCR
jgi:hypothetical protein